MVNEDITAHIQIAERLWSQDRGEEALPVIRQLATEYPENPIIGELLELYSRKLSHLESDEAYCAWNEYVTEVTRMGYLDDSVWRCFWIVARIKALAEVDEFNSLLDIGCCRGEMTVRFAESPGLKRIVGVDFIPLMVEQARTNPANTEAIEYLVCNAEQLDTLFTENEFDIAVLGGLLEHVRHPDIVLAQARRVVKPGGAILINVPFGGFTHYGYPQTERYGHVRFWNPYQHLVGQHMEIEYKSYYKEPGLPWAQFDEIGDFCILLWNQK